MNFNEIRYFFIFWKNKILNTYNLLKYLNFINKFFMSRLFNIYILFYKYYLFF